MTKKVKPLSWWCWYREARAEMAFRQGLRGIPVDVYKTQYAMGASVSEACRVIADHYRSYGSYPR